MKCFVTVGLCLCVVGGLVSSCASLRMGVTKEVEGALYDTNSRVRNLDKGLDGAVQKLIETTAQLSARLDQTDQEARRLSTLVEDNAVKLDLLAQQLGEFKTTYYRQSGLTVSPSPSMAPPGSFESGVGGVVIEGPGGSAPPPPASGGDLRAAVDTGLAAVVTDVVPLQDPEVQYRQAQRSFAKDDFSAALTQFSDFLVSHPGSKQCANAQFWKAMCHLQMAKNREAIEEFQALRDMYSDDQKVPLAIHNQAVAHSRLGEREEAVRLFQEVIDQYPVSPAADQSKLDLQKLQVQ